MPNALLLLALALLRVVVLVAPVAIVCFGVGQRFTGSSFTALCVLGDYIDGDITDVCRDGYRYLNSVSADV
jgi:hypothetical protein